MSPGSVCFYNSCCWKFHSEVLLFAIKPVGDQKIAGFSIVEGKLWPAYVYFPVPFQRNKGPLIFAHVWVPDKVWSVETCNHGEGAPWGAGGLDAPSSPAGQFGLVSSAPGPLWVLRGQIVSKWGP